MSKVLIIAEHDGQSLNLSTAKTVACAAGIPGASIDVLVLADSATAVAGEAAKLDSVSRVLTVENSANAQALAAVLAPQIVSLAAGYSLVLGPTTTFGKDLMPRVAALLGVNQITDIMAVLDAHTFKRPIYAGTVVTSRDVRSRAGWWAMAE
jgi:electron transfer flavoprotein alpha subunit